MKAVVLLSGGLDSSTCLALAVRELGAGEVLALSVSYGQKHAREVRAARDVAAHYQVALEHLDLSCCFARSTSSLLDHSSEDIPHEDYAAQLQDRPGGLVSTYVPFRNGLMLSAAAAWAQSAGAERIIYGAHADDAAGRAYPDCSPEFVRLMGGAIREGTGGGMILEAPFLNSTKADIVRTGLELGVPYELTWSCYEGGKHPCGVCGTCRDRIRAFRLNGAEDPLDYRTATR